MASNCSRGSVKRPHFTFVWALENVSLLTNPRTLCSPTFVVQTMERTKWHLEANLNGGIGDFVLFLCRETNSCSQLFEIDFEFSLVAEDSYILAQLNGASEFHKLGSHRCEAVFSGDVLNEHLPHEIFTVRCRMWRKGCDELQSDLCFARTRLGVEQQSFIWAIKRYSTLRAGQGRTIFWHSNVKYLPTLTLTFCIQEKDGKEYSCIKVDRNEPMGAHSIGIGVYLLDVDGWSGAFPKTFVRALITDEDKNVCEIAEFFEKEEITRNSAKFLSNDVLSLRCEFEINSGVLWSRIENYRLLESSDSEAFASEWSETHFNDHASACCSFKDILGTLYVNGTFSDISLKAGSESFSAHKNILGARSPIFEKMFIKDMREKTEKCVDIPDLSAETLRRLLLFIYTDRVEGLQLESALDLFKAADKYELMELRDICSDFFQNNISTSNACDILVLADMYHDDNLRIATQDFISQDSNIFYSDSWKNLKEVHTKLAFETAEKIICNNRD